MIQESSQGMPPFTNYRSHEERSTQIRRLCASDLQIKPPGVRGYAPPNDRYEIMREDMQDPEHQRRHERHMNAFRTQRGTRQDHHGPNALFHSPRDGENVPERRSKAATEHRSTMNPITSTWMNVDTGARPADTLQCNQIANNDFPAGTTSRRTGRAHAWNYTIPSTDPISPIVTQHSPNPAAQSLRQRENDRLWGTLGIKHRSPPQGSYDPIRHKYTAAPTIPTDASRGSHTRTVILAGESWGQRDPIQGQWTLRPRSATSCRVKGGVANSCRAPVPIPRSQGVYDPIKNAWLSPPQDPRIVEGLSFTPRNVFLN